MATKDFEISWIDVYNKTNGWSVKATGHPIRAGGSAEWHSFIPIPPAVKEALRTSSTPPSLQMRLYVTSGSSEIDIGHHRLSSSRGLGASGMPWYAYNETWRNTSGTGYRNYEMTNWFMPQFLDGNVQGIVLYSAGGRFSLTADGGGSASNPIIFRVTGTWNTPPSIPSNVRVDRSTVDTNQMVRWNASTDSEQSQSSLRYDVEFYNGSRWIRRITNTEHSPIELNTTGHPETEHAMFRVRAYDGELYSNWGYSSYFTIRHVPPSFSASAVTYQDINTTTTNITGNNQHIIQNASRLRVSINNAASANEDKTITRYIASIAGKELSRTTTGTLDFGTIDASTNQTLTITAVDSSGLKTTVTKDVNIVRYEVPDIQFSAKRVGNIADETVVKLSGSISPLNINGSNKNSLQTTRFRYAVRNSNNWSSWFTFSRSTSGTSFTATDAVIMINSINAWDIQFHVSDRVGETYKNMVVQAGKPIFFIDWDLESLGMGTFPSEDHIFDLVGEMKLTGNIFMVGDSARDGVTLAINPRGGNAHIELGATNRVNSPIIDFRSSGIEKDYDVRIVGEGGGYNNGDGILNVLADKFKVNNEELITRGSNSNGYWSRLYDGTQIVYGEMTYDRNGSVDQTKLLPTTFLDNRVAIIFSADSVANADIDDSMILNAGLYSGGGSIRLRKHANMNFRGTGNLVIAFMAIGRWR